MNRIISHLTLFCFAFGLITAPVIGAQPVQVLSPPDMASVRSRSITLVSRVKKDSYDSIRVENNGTGVPTKSFPDNGFDIRHSSISLSDGKNTIRIEVEQGGRQQQEKVITVFRRSSLSEQYSNAPSGFSQYRFHTNNNEITCSPCHKELMTDSAGTQDSETGSSCYGCHKRITDYKFVHGPASVGACVTCHKKDSPKTKNIVPDPEVTACLMCHTDEIESWQSEKFGHGPTMAGKCAICHNPHASDQNFFLVKEVKDLCGSCHAEKLSGVHVIMGFSGKGHPVKKGDTKNGKRTVSCVSCHNPHAANNASLLVKFKGSKIAFCHNCHTF